MQECPICKSKYFFVRDPEDKYEVIPFELAAKGAVFIDGYDPSTELYPEWKVFCDHCSRHGAYAKLCPA